MAREGMITQNQKINVEYPVDKPIQTLRKTLQTKNKKLIKKKHAHKTCDQHDGSNPLHRKY
ncbi:MAG: hypothetical protein QXH24_06090 [Candidatus Bathyarchaeia archaeon]